MQGYKVLAKDGLKGPFKKSSILKAITSAMLPLQARLLDLQTGRYIMAAELVGEQIDTHHAQPRPEKMTKAPLQKQKNFCSKPTRLSNHFPRSIMFSAKSAERKQPPTRPR